LTPAVARLSRITAHTGAPPIASRSLSGVFVINDGPRPGAVGPAGPCMPNSVAVLSVAVHAGRDDDHAPRFSASCGAPTSPRGNAGSGGIGPPRKRGETFADPRKCACGNRRPRRARQNSRPSPVAALWKNPVRVAHDGSHRNRPGQQVASRLTSGISHGAWIIWLRIAACQARTFKKVTFAAPDTVSTWDSSSFDAQDQR